LKKIIIIIFFSLFIILNTFNVSANNDIYVIPGGESIGLKIETGVEVVGKYSVLTDEGKVNPWSDSKIEVGDYIIEVNNDLINNNEQLIDKIRKSNQMCYLKIKRQ
jgi:PDZ domain-containing secreted protein